MLEDNIFSVLNKACDLNLTISPLLIYLID